MCLLARHLICKNRYEVRGAGYEVYHKAHPVPSTQLPRTFMQVVTNIQNFPKGLQTAVTVGVFDGVHIAHRLILDELKHKAKEHSAVSVVITFDKHPCEVIAPERYGKEVFLLTTLDEKIELFREIGIDYLVVLPFTKEFAKLSYSEFIEDIIVKNLNPKLFLVGFNHNFGNNRDGNFEKLQELAKKHGFQAEIFQEKYFDGQKISSSEIRKLIQNGEIQRANQLLGHIKSYEL